MKRIVMCIAIVLSLAGGLLAVELPAAAAKTHHTTDKKTIVVRGPRGPRGPRAGRQVRRVWQERRVWQVRRVWQERRVWQVRSH